MAVMETLVGASSGPLCLGSCRTERLGGFSCGQGLAVGVSYVVFRLGASVKVRRVLLGSGRFCQGSPGGVGCVLSR